jgi:hypothetical protein
MKRTTFKTVLRQNCAVFVEICEFSICGLIIKNLRTCDLRTGTSKKLADLQYRNEPKNLRTCELRTLKKSLHVHLW